MKHILLLAILFALTACGGGGGDSPAPATWTGKVNSAGYPDVAGNYSLNTGTFSYTATDGSSGTAPPMASNSSMAQTDNQLFVSPGSNNQPNPNLTEISGDQLKGNIDKNGKFILNRSAVMTVTNTLGTNTVNYSLTGNFTESGWSGVYKYSVYNDYLKATATYSTTFNGDRIVAKIASKALPDTPEIAPIKYEGNPNDLKYSLWN